jgi:hypothetical protein
MTKKRTIEPKHADIIVYRTKKKDKMIHIPIEDAEYIKKENINLSASVHNMIEYDRNKKLTNNLKKKKKD